MKKNKLLLPLLLVGSLIGLTGCSLFDDADIAIHNEYNPMPETPPEDPDAVVAGGVKASTNERLQMPYASKTFAMQKMTQLPIVIKALNSTLITTKTTTAIEVVTTMTYMSLTA